jgi:hypothetical protein
VSSLSTHEILLVWGKILTQPTKNFHFQLVQDSTSATAVRFLQIVLNWFSLRTHLRALTTRILQR